MSSLDSSFLRYALLLIFSGCGNQYAKKATEASAAVGREAEGIDKNRLLDAVENKGPTRTKAEDIATPAEGDFAFIDDPTEKSVESCTDLFKMEMPRDHGDSSAGSFTYHAEIVNRGAAKTVIRIEGGPGLIPRGNVTPYSNSYNLINIIPRGIDCNIAGESPYFTLQQLTSTQHAKDIKKLILDNDVQNYVVWGHSYGTVVATILGDLLADVPEKNKPKAVLLEGVLGTKGLYNVPEASWNSIMDFLSNPASLDYDPEIVQAFSDPSHLPLGISQGKWASYIPGIVNPGPSAIFSFLRDLVAMDKYGNAQQKQQAVQNIDAAYGSTGFPKGGTSFYLAIFCQELRRVIPDFDKGNFSASKLSYSSAYNANSETNKYCASLPQIPYHPSNFQIEAPLYYANGNWDANTPLDEAKAHAATQTSSSKEFFMTVGLEGHSPLSSPSGALASCNLDVWAAIFAGLDPNGSVLHPNPPAGTGRCKSDSPF